MNPLSLLCKGFLTSGSLIVAIGAQNAYVLRQGLSRHHLFLTASLCAAIDAILIFLGVAGLGRSLTSHPLFLRGATYFAIAFLAIYGSKLLFSAMRPQSMAVALEDEPPSVKQTVILLLSLSLLNPHVYLDTVLLLGSIAAQHAPHEQPLFALGAIAASFCWFFGLAYGARLLAPLLQTPKAWRAIDLITGLTLWGVAWGITYSKVSLG